MLLSDVRYMCLGARRNLKPYKTQSRPPLRPVSTISFDAQVRRKNLTLAPFLLWFLLPTQILRNSAASRGRNWSFISAACPLVYLHLHPLL